MFFALAQFECQVECLRESNVFESRAPPSARLQPAIQRHSRWGPRVGYAMRGDESHSTPYRTVAVRHGDEPDAHLACPWCRRQAMGNCQRMNLHPAASCNQCGRRVALSMRAVLRALVVALASFVMATSCALVLEPDSATLAAGVCLLSGYGGAFFVVALRSRLVRAGSGNEEFVRPESAMRFASNDFNCARLSAGDVSA
jgi:hypothetical protein